ncbi:hypothetical protein BZA70DRAFT_294408 [Myxozyma melibiosi]|uniref:Uncharacterized protein n=1 Tax=Myxozyma melibiosi TaxID=54550 RepID=A0ABR1F8D2_9ASCO
MSLLDYILTLPQFTDSRLPSLFSDFRRLKESNPDGYQANITAWKTALVSALRRSTRSPDPDSSSTATTTTTTTTDSVLVLHSGATLLAALTSPTHGHPLALSAVFEDQTAQHRFVPLATFLAQQTSIYKDSQWKLVKLGASLARWAVRDTRVGEYYDAVVAWRRREGLAEEEYVVLENVEDAARVLVARVKARAGAGRFAGVYSVEVLKELFSSDPFGKMEEEEEDDEELVGGKIVKRKKTGPVLSDQDWTVLIRHITRDMQQATTSPSGSIIKFKLAASTLTPLTEEEQTVAQLRAMVHHLSTRIASQHQLSLSSRQKSTSLISTRPQTAHTKQLALTQLKTAKMAEATVRKTMEYRMQLEALISSIEAAHDNLEMTRIMRSSLPVLRDLNKRAGGAEKVADLVEQIESEVEETKEVGRIISETTVEDVDEDDIEAEYARLLEEESSQSRRDDKKKEEENEDELADMLSKASLADVPDLEDKKVEPEKMTV